jgi:beta-phosphoglucomutase
MRYRAVAFDLGGVLLDSEGAHESAARRVAARFRLAVPEDAWWRIRGGAYEDFFGYVLSLPANVGCGVCAMQVVLQAYEFYYDEVRCSARLFPGIDDVLSLSRSLFGQVAIATSSEWRLVDAVLRHFRLAEQFDGVITGDHLTQRKPAPEAFLVTAWLLGIRPDRMLVVEDSAHGVRAARLARTHVIGIATNKDPQALRSAGAHHVARDHGELAACICRLGEEGRAGPE